MWICSRVAVKRMKVAMSVRQLITLNNKERQNYILSQEQFFQRFLFVLTLRKDVTCFHIFILKLLFSNKQS